MPIHSLYIFNDHITNKLVSISVHYACVANTLVNILAAAHYNYIANTVTYDWESTAKS